MAISRTYPAIAIALGYKIIMAMAFPGCARLSVKRLQILYAYAIIFLFFINVIAPGLS